PDDLHFFRDSHVLVQRSRPVREFGQSVEAFLITSLQPWPPKVALNLEIGDYGRVEQRACGCALGAIGLQDHIADIRSHEKLTGEGMTFVKSHLTKAVEDVLPRCFGGSSLDYQLLEEEDRNGILRVFLLASPALGPLDPAEIEQTFLAELAQGSQLDAHMARTWAQAGTIKVRREAPVVTKAGKVLPFHVVRL